VPTRITLPCTAALTPSWQRSDRCISDRDWLCSSTAARGYDPRLPFCCCRRDHYDGYNQFLDQYMQLAPLGAQRRRLGQVLVADQGAPFCTGVKTCSGTVLPYSLLPSTYSLNCPPAVLPPLQLSTPLLLLICLPLPPSSFDSGVTTMMVTTSFWTSTCS
jgi:hypothetical protein